MNFLQQQLQKEEEEELQQEVDGPVDLSNTQFDIQSDTHLSHLQDVEHEDMLDSSTALAI